MPAVYVDSSVLIAFLYEEKDQPEKFQQARRLISAIRGGLLSGVVSFYALPELYGHVRENQPANEINNVFRLSLVELFSAPIIVMPFLERAEFRNLRQQFRISDPEDVRHVAAALSSKCDAIITFDYHFRQVSNLIPVYTPEEYLAKLESTQVG